MYKNSFMMGRSGCTHMLEILNDWTLAVQNGRAVAVAYILILFHMINNY